MVHELIFSQYATLSTAQKKFIPAEKCIFNTSSMKALHPYVLSPPESKRIRQQRRMPCLLSCQLNTSRSYDSRVYRASQILCYIVHTAPAPVDLRVWSSEVLIYG